VEVVSTERFTVRKEYLEDLGEQDEQGYYDYAYRYFAYWFDFGERQYWAKVYTDTPDEAGVGGPLRHTDSQSRDDLQAIARYLKAHEGIRVVTSVGPGGGYEPIEDHWPGIEY
jgi:hypothetical protein